MVYKLLLPVLAKWQALRPTTLIKVLHVSYASKVNVPALGSSVSTHHDIPNDVGGAGRIPNPARRIGGIVARSKVIELVSGFSSFFPYSQTDTAVLRRASGVYDFRPIAVPLSETDIERCAVGRRARASITLGSERKFPHSDNRFVGVVLGHQ